jgi:hypothetical protein
MDIPLIERVKIMQGARHCDFRYSLSKQAPET